MQQLLALGIVAETYFWFDEITNITGTDQFLSDLKDTMRLAFFLSLMFIYLNYWVYLTC